MRASLVRLVAEFPPQPPQRWTMAKLAAQEPTPELGRTILDDIANRLERQIHACQKLLALSNEQHSSSQTQETVNARQKMQQQLQFLLHVHKDTALQCRQILNNRPQQFWETWSNTHQRTVRQCLEAVRDRHSPSLERWVDVAIAAKHAGVDSTTDNNTAAATMTHLVHQILQGRLSIQLLTHHYSLLTQHQDSRKMRRPTGAIAVNHSLADMVHDAHTEAHFLCQAHYQRAPGLELQNLPDDLMVTVVRPWLTHCLVEVCKNGMCATVQKSDDEQGPKAHTNNVIDEDHFDTPPPPLIVSASVDDQVRNAVVLTVRDHGTGVPTNEDKRKGGLEAFDPFEWGTSSAKSRWDRLKEQQTYAAVRPPLASLGVGLPSSRAMLRHFGGDLELLPASSLSSSGGGTMARLVLPLDTDIPEHLPPHFSVVESEERPSNDKIVAEHEVA